MSALESHVIEATLCFALRGDPVTEILLGRKKRGFGRGKLNGIGGKIEPGERPIDCIIREVKEEVGIDLCASSIHEMGQITFRFPFHPDYDHYVHVFVATAWSGEPTETPEMEPEWFNVEDIPYTEMWQDDAHWLPRVLAGESIRASFTFGADNETLTDWEIESVST